MLVIYGFTTVVSTFVFVPCTLPQRANTGQGIFTASVDMPLVPVYFYSKLFADRQKNKLLANFSPVVLRGTGSTVDLATEAA